MEYALDLSQIFSEMKFSVYQDAVAHFVEAAELAMISQVSHFVTTVEEEKKHNEGVNEKKDKREGCSSLFTSTTTTPARSSCCAALLAPTLSSLFPASCKVMTTARSRAMPCGTLSNASSSYLQHVPAIYRDFLLSKPPSGAVVLKPMEECVDVCEYKMHEAYFNVFQQPVKRKKCSQHKQTENTTLSSSFGGEGEVEEEEKRRDHCRSCCSRSGSAASSCTSSSLDATPPRDGYVLTKEDQAVLTWEAHIQDSPAWWMEVIEEEEKREADLYKRHSSSSGEHPPVHATPCSLTTTTTMADRNNHMGLYGELTSRGLRQIQALHWTTIAEYEAGMNHSAGESPAPSSPLPCILAVDIGSGTGKVIFEWSLLLQQQQQYLEEKCLRHTGATTFPPTTATRLPTLWMDKISPPSSSPFSSCVSWPRFCAVVLGIEIIPSRMTTAKKVLRGQFMEITETEKTVSVAACTEAGGADGRDGERGKEHHYSPRKEGMEPGAGRALTTSPGRRRGSPSSSNNPTTIPISPLIVLPPNPHTHHRENNNNTISVANPEYHTPMYGKEVHPPPPFPPHTNIWLIPFCSSSFTRSRTGGSGGGGGGGSFCASALSQVNALHPFLLHNDLLLPPPFLSFSPSGTPSLPCGSSEEPSNVETNEEKKEKRNQDEKNSKEELQRMGKEGQEEKCGRVAPAGENSPSPRVIAAADSGVAHAQQVIVVRRGHTPLCQPHLLVFCCGLGFDELFVRRLCWRIERMLDCPHKMDAIPAMESNHNEDEKTMRTGESTFTFSSSSPFSADSLTSPRPSLNYGWQTASIVLILPPFDVEKVLQSNDFPLFRLAQEWRRWEAVSTEGIHSASSLASHEDLKDQGKERAEELEHDGNSVFHAMESGGRCSTSTSPGAPPHTESGVKERAHPSTSWKEVAFFRRDLFQYSSAPSLDCFDGKETKRRMKVKEIIDEENTITVKHERHHDDKKEERNHYRTVHYPSETVEQDGETLFCECRGKMRPERKEEEEPISSCSTSSRCCCRCRRGGGRGCRRLRSSVLTRTHLETTWMKESPAWHFSFIFS